MISKSHYREVMSYEKMFPNDPTKLNAGAAVRLVEHLIVSIGDESLYLSGEDAAVTRTVELLNEYEEAPEEIPA